MLCCSLVSKHLLFALQPADRVYSHKLCVVTRGDWSTFGVLQSRIHEVWARTLSSTLENRLNYTPSTCFETFPFPRPTPSQQKRLESAGQQLYVTRTDVQRRLGLGLTKLWNRVEDPSEDRAEIVELRRLRAELDRAVLAAYGWEEELGKEEILRRLRGVNLGRGKF